MGNKKKIEETLESEEPPYVMWCNGLGLANLVELSQKHARKCKETCVPLLNGFKVSCFQGSPDQNFGPFISKQKIFRDVMEL